MLLWLLGSAWAWDADSLRSDASFGLFRDEYDFLREPATLSDQKGTHLFTTLGNQGGTTRLSLGGLGPVGPGVLGVMADGGLAGSGTTVDTEVAPSAGGPGTATSTLARSAAHDLGGFVGYGLALGDSAAVGLGVEVTTRRWDTTLAPSPGAPPVIGGSLHGTTEDGAATSVEDGSWRETGRELRAIVGGALLAERVSVEGDLHLGHGRASASGRATRATPDESYLFEGYHPGAPLAGNAQGLVPGAAVDVTARLDDALSLRVFAEAARGRLTPVVASSNERQEDPTGGWERRETLEDPAMSVADGEALVALHVDRDPVALRVGIAFAGEVEDLAASRSRVAHEASGSTTSAVATRSRSTYAELALPVATEVEASKTVTLRAGGRWRLARVGQALSETLLTEPREGDVVSDARSTHTVTSWVELSLGLRWQPAEAFSLDAVAVGVGAGEDRAVVDLTRLLLSGVLHF